MATPIRFELTIFAVTGRHVNRYTTGPFFRVTHCLVSTLLVYWF